jgi:SAM-dependent methyltransferase
MAKSGNIISGPVRRIRWVVQRHGIADLLRLATEHIAWFATKRRPSIRAEIREREQRAAAFDKSFGVDTAGCIHPTKLNINNPNQLHAVSYGGSDPKFFSNAIAALPIDYRRFVFVDFGSGKGRAILMATDFPFKRIVGVEFSEELHRIAQNNIRRFHSDTCKCESVEPVCMDAVNYPLPDDCLVCYFCNPFDSTIMAQVLSNIRKSFFRNPRDIFIVYYNPKEGHLVDQTDCFRRVGTSSVIRIWRTTLESRHGQAKSNNP